MMNPVLHSSRDLDWETPPGLFRELDEEFGFTLDVCASPDTAKCERYFAGPDYLTTGWDAHTPPVAIDGLAQEWSGVCFMNPPYGREIPKWIAKAYQEAEAGRATVVCLIPARTDTSYWHDFVMKGEVRFLRGRVKFLRGGEVGPAPFPSAIVIFRRRNYRRS